MFTMRGQTERRGLLSFEHPVFRLSFLPSIKTMNKFLSRPSLTPFIDVFCSRRWHKESGVTPILANLSSTFDYEDTCVFGNKMGVFLCDSTSPVRLSLFLSMCVYVSLSV